MYSLIPKLRQVRSRVMCERQINAYAISGKYYTLLQGRRRNSFSSTFSKRTVTQKLRLTTRPHAVGNVETPRDIKRRRFGSFCVWEFGRGVKVDYYYFVLAII